MALAAIRADTTNRRDVDESRSTQAAMGITPSEAQLNKMLSDMDADGSGQIEYDEFLKTMGPHMKDFKIGPKLGGMKVIASAAGMKLQVDSAWKRSRSTRI